MGGGWSTLNCPKSGGAKSEVAQIAKWPVEDCADTSLKSKCTAPPRRPLRRRLTSAVYNRNVDCGIAYEFDAVGGVAAVDDPCLLGNCSLFRIRHDAFRLLTFMAGVPHGCCGHDMQRVFLRQRIAHPW